VDMMCFEPHLVEKTFHQGLSPKPPTKNVKDICDVILKQYTGKVNEVAEAITPLGRRKSFKISPRITDYENDILNAARKLKIYTKYSDDKIFQTVCNAGDEYFKDRMESRGKNLIKPEMWQQCAATAMTLMTHPYTAKYFAQGVKGIEIIYQFKFDVVVNGRRVKGMLDCVVINHNAKLIFPVDLKTGEAPNKEFPMLYTLHRYHIQGALYREALKSIVDNDFELMEYEVKPFEFVYISKLNPNKPSRFSVSEDMHQAALVGFTDKYGYEYRGVYDLMDDYYYSKENNNAMYSQEEADNKGLIEMNTALILGK
ncbi:MAG: PD-(D/E)XK nuclease-like domain-containing protein, partial [Gammaproteobacteria bacterium]|nr:PD-(D/E)XK nuclease-like domain-containing protein [Gammaproteobacteria bacterium]